MMRTAFATRLSLSLWRVRGIARQRAVMRAVELAVALEAAGEERPPVLLRGVARSSWRCRFALGFAKLLAQQPALIAGGAIAAAILAGSGLRLAAQAVGIA